MVTQRSFSFLKKVLSSVHNEMTTNSIFYKKKLTNKKQQTNRKHKNGKSPSILANINASWFILRKHYYI